VHVSVTETARLRLRKLTRSDEELILELLNDPDFVANVGDRGVRTREDACRYIVSGPVASYARHGFGLYVVELKSPALAIGLCGLLRRDTHPDVEVGFALLPRFRGCGYTLEAARAVIQLGLGPLALTRIVALAAPGNVASIRILEALGLKFERRVAFADENRPWQLFVLDTAHQPTADGIGP
jgi:[ribosomal protein S5]-alanine N-acetyltransferase